MTALTWQSVQTFEQPILDLVTTVNDLLIVTEEAWLPLSTPEHTPRPLTGSWRAGARHGETFATLTTSGATLHWPDGDAQVPGSSTADALWLTDDELWLLHSRARKIERWAVQRGFTRPALTHVDSLPFEPLLTRIVAHHGQPRLIVVTSRRLQLGAPRGVVSIPLPRGAARAHWLGRDGGQCWLLIDVEPAPGQQPGCYWLQVDLDTPDQPPRVIPCAVPRHFEDAQWTPHGLLTAFEGQLWWWDSRGRLHDILPLPSTAPAHLSRVDGTLFVAQSNTLWSASWSALDPAPRPVMRVLPQYKPHAQATLQTHDAVGWRQHGMPITWTRKRRTREEHAVAWTQTHASGDVIDVSAVNDTLWTLHDQGWVHTWNLAHPNAPSPNPDGLIVPAPRRLIRHPQENAWLAIGRQHATVFWGSRACGSLSLDADDADVVIYTSAAGWLLGAGDMWWVLRLDTDAGRPILTLKRPRLPDDQAALLASGDVLLVREGHVTQLQSGQRDASVIMSLPSHEHVLLATDRALIALTDSDGMELLTGASFETRARRLTLPAKPVLVLDDTLIVTWRDTAWRLTIGDAEKKSTRHEGTRVPVRNPFHLWHTLEGLSQEERARLHTLCREAALRWHTAPDTSLMDRLVSAAITWVALDLLWQGPNIPRRDVEPAEQQRALAKLASARFTVDDLRILANYLEPNSLAWLARALQPD